MIINNMLEELEQRYNLIKVINLDFWDFNDYESSQALLNEKIKSVKKDVYEENERIVFVHSSGDLYTKNTQVGLILKNIQNEINEIDVSNYFVIILSNNPNFLEESEYIKKMSTDTVPMTFIQCEDGKFNKIHIDHHPHSKKEIYEYGSANPLKINLNEVSKKERFLLEESKTFCMYPWIHMHAWPTGEAFPCCMSEHDGKLGDTKTQTLKEIWNGEEMKSLRNNMLNEKPSSPCVRCYEQEKSGFFSGRKSANKHHGHHIQKVFETNEDGSYDKFGMTYWDIRFSNLCNLKCRSCGHIFSSNWYNDQAKLAGGDWKKNNKALNFAGRWETDVWEQLVEHLDYVEQIYFAGGEPLLMEEHYRILDELEKRERFDVRLIYNTNFTETSLKGRSVFDYWKKFDSVAVGASLDAADARGEYIRKGTKWDRVTKNREEMLKVCPEVDFYVSPTLSIMNAWHLPDFHRDWVSRGFIRAQDLNVNILQDPPHYRIDIAPDDYKQKLKEKYENHLEWLRPFDKLNRASVGFESAISFMMSTNNQHLIPEFWSRTRQLDEIRNEDILDILPELKAVAV